MTETRLLQRWRELTAEALARDGHRCRLGLTGCAGTASAVVMVREPSSEPAKLDELVSACPVCVEQHNQLTPEQLLAEELEDVADERLILHVIDPVTGEVLATDRTSNTRRSLAQASIEAREHRKPPADDDEYDDYDISDEDEDPWP